VSGLQQQQEGTSAPVLCAPAGPLAILPLHLGHGVGVMLWKWGLLGLLLRLLLRLLLGLLLGQLLGLLGLLLLGDVEGTRVQGCAGLIQLAGVQPERRRNRRRCSGTRGDACEDEYRRGRGAAESDSRDSG
jgi:hypothetical protein